MISGQSQGVDSGLKVSIASPRSLSASYSRAGVDLATCLRDWPTEYCLRLASV